VCSLDNFDRLISGSVSNTLEKQGIADVNDRPTGLKLPLNLKVNTNANPFDLHDVFNPPPGNNARGLFNLHNPVALFCCP
jgi:hypothetical protein